MSQLSPAQEIASDERSPNEDRRAAVRYRVEATAPCQSLQGDAVCGRAKVHDVSTYGIGLILGNFISPGTLLAVELENQEGGPVRSLKARVVHIEKHGTDTWLLRCAFINELDEPQLQLFQAHQVKPASPDFRRWVRFPCNVETVCYTCETAPGERRAARILNISAGGIGLLLPCQFSGGTLLHLELPAEAARLALIRVVRIIEHTSGSWFHGCELVDQLGAEELNELLR